jgi:hypothetical protein
MRAWELNESFESVVYHTTSSINAKNIMDTGIIKPRDGESFVSFSKKPFTGDISHNEVTLKINSSNIASDIMEVIYTEQWYEKYTDHAAYIAGEGWKDQFITPDECYDDEGEEDTDCYNQAYRDAELDSFLWKKNEEELISKVMGEPILIKNATFNEDDDYHGEHSAPEKDRRNTLDDLTDVYPEDIYSGVGARYYGQGDPQMDNSAISIIIGCRNRPRRLVTAYRAVPHEATKDEKLNIVIRDMARYQRRGNMPASSTFSNGSDWFNDAYERREKLEKMPETPKVKTSINPGDWVTITRNYAKEHGRDNLNNKFKIISKKVKASELATFGDSLHEWGYSP